MALRVSICYRLAMRAKLDAGFLHEAIKILIFTYLIQSSKSVETSAMGGLLSSENHGLKLQNRFFLPFLFFR